MALMNKRYLVLLALLACLTGCDPVDSLNPLYTAKDVVFDHNFEGVWATTETADQTTLEVVTMAESSTQIGYLLTMSTREKDGKCSNLEAQGRLVSLGGHRFLDVMPNQWGPKSEVYPLRIQQSQSGSTIAPQILRLGVNSYMEFAGGAHPQARLRQAHWFFKVWTDGKKLRLDWVDDDKFMKAVGQGKFHVTHAVLDSGKDKNIVITASTLELQKFVTDHADDPDLFTEHMKEMERTPR